ncbi:MAG: hypothetical protein OXR84_03695 [Magnetovibrio sp.]|nr:hypothetical protein [Magnetovibrio sp.]
MLIAVSDGLPMPLFAALAANKARVSFALHAPLTAAGIDGWSGEAIELPRRPRKFAFAAPLCRDPKGAGLLRLVDRVDIDLKDLTAAMNPRRLGPCTNLYIAFDPERRRFLPPYNKLVESFAAKDDGAHHIAQRQVNVVGQVLLPFPDSNPAEGAARLTINREVGFWTNADPETVDNDHRAHAAFVARVFPRLEVTPERLTVAPDGRTTVGVQLTDAAGASLQRPDVRLFAKSAAGYLPRTEVSTDADGRAAIVFLALGLVAGDTADIEVGFKWRSNIARCRVEVA